METAKEAAASDRQKSHACAMALLCIKITHATVLQTHLARFSRQTSRTLSTALLRTSPSSAAHATLFFKTFELALCGPAPSGEASRQAAP